MGQRFKNSWEMIKASAKVLNSDKRLLIFPIISSIGVIIITLPFAIPFFQSGSLNKSYSLFSTNNLPLIFIYYFLIYTVIIFFNSALVGAAIISLKGGHPSISDGIKVAVSHFPQVLGYAFIAATIGLLLRWIQEKLGLFGKIFSFIANISWNLATFLVIPTLVNENIGPIKAIKRSANLLKKTWGEQIIANIGIGIVFGLFIMGLVLIFIPLIIITSTGNLNILGMTLGGILFLSIILIMVLSSTINTIYTAALYRYASDGVISDSFNEDTLKDSFKQK